MTSQGRTDTSGTDQRPCQYRYEQEVMVLLEEYRTLREEVTQRVAARMQMIGFAGAISALLVVSDSITFRGPNLYVAGLFLVLAVVWLRGTNLAIQRIGRHLRVVEARVNALAARAWGSSEHLLTWETDVQTGRVAVRGVPGRTGRLGGWYVT
ncbi:hypothetical protein GLX30_02900 [Streptomyces sp. Tu 2975]|uniref:hypothetical protein n=1 Tax=Streptomyces sp. Tu 2975 TaxID=2676871 RepID=UPI001359E5B7|nr:hypothetical protein [Streptomyces sp. Tu 2975]QIP83198.1 hypothetical protein GLX30_02900 [Streptomyces sp. Tu 2975]